MFNEAFLFIAIGSILLVSLFVNTLGQRTILPRVTLLLVLGAVIGPDGLDLIPQVLTDQFNTFADLALLMVGFLLGGKLTLSTLRQTGNEVFWISLSAALLTLLIVALGLLAAGVATAPAILLGSIASATAPAAIYDVVNEYQLKGKFSDLLLAIVALDDAWALILFGLSVAFVSALNGGTIATALTHVSWDILGALAIGGAIGLPAAYLTGRIRTGQPMLIEALGIVCLCGGLSMWLNVSFLIASMTMGFLIANLAKHHEYPFHEIENIEWPIMVIFFVLAGASLNVSAMKDIGLIGSVYILCRFAGKYIGAWLGGVCSHADSTTRHWMGLCLLPQAGVGIGLALVASKYFPQHRELLLTVVVGSTIIFEFVGPVMTRIALLNATQEKRQSASVR